MWNGMMMGWAEGWGVFAMIHMLLWWVLILLGIVVLARWAFGCPQRGKKHEDSALTILRERYARGEIDKAEFEARKRDLE